MKRSNKRNINRERPMLEDLMQQRYYRNRDSQRAVLYDLRTLISLIFHQHKFKKTHNRAHNEVHLQI
jgi:hypothetical protein